MDEYVKTVKLTAAAVAGTLSGLWGWMGWLVVGWIGCMVMDYLTGTAAGTKNGGWSSEKAREGIWHKMGMVVVVIVAAGADLLIALVLEHLPVLQLPLQYSGLVCPVVLVWYIITELGSMTENAVAMGAAVPHWLLRLLAVSKDALDQAGDKMAGKEDKNDF